LLAPIKAVGAASRYDKPNRFAKKYAIAKIHHALYPDIPLKSRYEIAKNYCDYVRSIQDQSVPLSILLKPLLNIAHGLSNARQWKQQLMQIQQHKTHLRLEDALEYLLALEGQSTDCFIKLV